MRKFLILFSFLLLSSSVFCQESVLSKQLEFENVAYPLHELLNEISSQTGVEFSYTSELNTNQYIKLPSLKGSLKYFLNEIIDTKAFKIINRDNKIFLVGIPPSERKYSISGFVTDSETGESLINASIVNLEDYTGTISNNFGFYSFTLNQKAHQLQISYVGYQNIIIDLNPKQDTSINISLQPNSILNEIKVLADQKSNNINHQFVSTSSLTSESFSNSGILGENDLFQNLVQFPGVQTSNEGLGGFIVRNGSPSQNLILLDDVPVYYSSHLLGLFSVFNPDAINHVKLIKGGFPAHYGGRVSSVLDIRMKDGNSKKLGGDFSIGLLTAKFNLHGPIKKDKTTFNLSVRRSYLDLLVNGILDLADSDINAGYYFGDLNFKLTHKFSQRDKIFFSTYWGGDLIKVKNTEERTATSKEKTENKVGWGNFTNSLRWNHVYSNHLFANTSLILSRYTFLVKDKRSTQNEDESFKENYNYQFRSGIRDFSLKTEFDWIPDAKHYLKFGMETSLHHTKPGSELYRNNDQDEQNTSNDQIISSKEIILFGECQIQFGKKFLVNIGSRWSSFIVEGTYYSTLEPRFSTQYHLNPKWTLTGSFSQMTQYLHLVTTSSLSLPTDLWLPVTSKIKPIDSFQYTGGTNYSISKSVKFSAEYYHKLSRNVLEFSDASFFQNVGADWEKMVVAGKSWSKGLEFNLSKTNGKTTGNMAYTLSKSHVKYPEINSGKTFASPYDRRHDFSVLFNQKLSKKVDFSIAWVYGSGLPATLSSTNVNAVSPYSPGSISSVPIFSHRNGFRLPDYHRMDFSINFRKFKKHGIRTWNLSINNVYNRKNANYVSISENQNEFGSTTYSLKQISLFSFLPSVSYSYKF
ncbi:TonB-dependent receptor [Labilibaculum antarcticum]|uniref:TonB-dependent receptor n=1 Tax=Labilibaculum antarcticum TaxID=1717717 RepID=UPI000BBB0C97|nr:carboxypeptidase-like regulatory domain-containing protein [Labilibaculum antarcticum]